jgi:hypothetical protein
MVFFYLAIFGPAELYFCGRLVFGISLKTWKIDIFFYLLTMLKKKELKKGYYNDK